MAKTRLDSYIDRITPTCCSVKNPYNIPISLFANENVPIEVSAIERLLEVVQIHETADRIGKADKSFWGDRPGKLNRVVLTPDFHYGEIPVGTVLETNGFVVPQAPGHDICCGMRLLSTDITRDEIEPYIEALMNALRAIFFQGKREIMMSPRQREALLREGLWGLLETNEDNHRKGIWKYYDKDIQSDDLFRVHFQGILPTKDIFSFGDYIRQSGKTDSYDSALGGVGQGNHFAEIQYIEEIVEGSTAYEWGLKKNCITIMIHAGSLGLGHTVGDYFKDKAVEIFPKKLKRPENGLFLLPTNGPHSEISRCYLDAMNNAANFAFGNRLCLGLMVVRALSEVLGREVGSRLVYDAPHNLIWENEKDGSHVHRKGACPSFGITEKFPRGMPVLIPGSMGSASYILAGQGNDSALNSACHGAGRAISRGVARKYSDLSEISKLKIVTPIDPNSLMIRQRQDILKEYSDRLMEEKTSSYKDIFPVIDTIRDSNIANPVSRLWPILTIKG